MGVMTMQRTGMPRQIQSNAGARVRPSSGSRASVVSVHASGVATPDLFSSWTHDSNKGMLPGHVQDYLSLLAESTTTSGGMQTHLFKLIAKGASTAHKLSNAVVDPIDSLSDYVADAGTDLVMEQINTPNSHWNKLRAAVLGSSAFKSTIKMHDDSFTPPPAIDPMHSKALGVLVSVLMSGAVSGAANAVPVDFATFSASHNGGVEISQVQSASSIGKFEHAPSFRAAPSFAIRGDDVATTGGMAASTAMKLLRADSRIAADAIPDLKDIFSSAFASIEECDEDCLGAVEKIAQIHKPANARVSGGGGGFAGNGGNAPRL